MRISTVDERFAFGGAHGKNYYNGALLKRRRDTNHWRVLAIQGGGAMTCAWWLRYAPAAVLTDLGIEGLYEGNRNFGYC